MKRVRHFLRRELLIILYQTLTEPYYRYCSVVWGQCCETLQDKLQVLQNRAAWTIARLKYEDADHEKLLIDFGWLNVRNLIAYDLGVFMFKTMSNIVSEDIIVPSLSSGKVEMFLCAACHAFTPQVNAWKALNRYCGSSLS